MTQRFRPKEMSFPVEVVWETGRRTTARVAGKAPLPIVTPPEFRGTDPQLWSPQDALVAAAGSCMAVTIVALAERNEIPLQRLSIDARGVVGRRPDGRFGFTRIEQTVDVETDDLHEEEMRALVATADERCVVSASPDLPVETTVAVRSRIEAPFT
jgi:organic hydroperoxide reductase OsmC/OhrA